MYHFDEIAHKYDFLIKDHVREHLLVKKSGIILDYLHDSGIHEGRGLDMGCGTGHYAQRMAEHGYNITGLDYSLAMLQNACNSSSPGTLKHVQASATALPFTRDAFDFAYTINVLHHIATPEDQQQALRELLRIVRPGGLLFILDFNCDNYFFRFYMERIFPLTSDIDNDAIDLWFSPSDIRSLPVTDAVLIDIKYFTLIPNFVPSFLFGIVTRAESFLERITTNRFGAQYVAVFRKDHVEAG